MPTDSHKHAFSGIMLVEQSLRIQQKEKNSLTLWTKERKTVLFNYLNTVSQPHNFPAFEAGNNLYC